MGEIERLGKYQIQSILGQGAMGVVYKGFDPVIGRTVALKTIRKGVFAAKDLEPMLTRLKHEAQAAGRLTHSGIVTVYDYGDEGETAFIAMEYVQGRELAELLERGERPNLATAIDMVNQLLDILGYFHTHGVVHRDIKPGNILVLADGRIKVTDFGIAKIEASDLTQFGDVLGTPSYMSPEQYEGLPVDGRSDLFSVGVLLYQLLTGAKPFPGTTMATIMQRVLNSVPAKVSELNGRLPANLDRVVEKALAKKARDRFQSAAEFSAALNQACLGLDLGSNGELVGCPFSSDPRGEATVALAATGSDASPPPQSAPGYSDLPVAAAKPHRLGPLLLAGLVLLALAAGWLGIRVFSHSAEPRREAAPVAAVNPATTPASVGAGERADVTVTTPANPRALSARRRPTLGASGGQAGSTNAVISKPTAKSARTNRLPTPPELPSVPTRESSPPPPPVAPIAPVTVEPVPPTVTPVGATTPSARQAITSPPGMGRKLREDEW